MSAVESQIVGYQNVDLKKGYNLLAVNWQGVGNADGKISLNDLIKAKDKLTSVDDNGINGDEIDTWSMSIHDWSTILYYCDHGDWGDEWADCWTDGEHVLNPQFDPGDAFWLITQNAVTALPFCGQVANSADCGVLTLKKGYNLLANAKPQPLNISASANQVIISNATSVDDGGANGDEINTWSLATHDWSGIYYYCDHGDWGDEWANCWTDGEQVVNPIVEAGTGFWYIAQKAGVTIQYK